jgi:hypothetical protein
MENKATEILHSFHNADTNMTSYVTKGCFGFHVSLQDMDSGEFVPACICYPEIDRAIAEAQKAVR